MYNWDVASGTIFLTVFIFGVVGLPYILCHISNKHSETTEVHHKDKGE